MGKSYASAREALLLNGKFVIDHLKSVDSKTKALSGLSDTPLVAAIEDEVILQKAQISYKPGGLLCK